ncbi:hypothetical protein R0J87_23010, partial [Halomonas sp. SIMBA_159]
QRTKNDGNNPTRCHKYSLMLMPIIVFQVQRSANLMLSRSVQSTPCDTQSPKRKSRLFKGGSVI